MALERIPESRDEEGTGMAIRALNKLAARQVDTLRDGVHSDGGNLLLYVHSNGDGRSWVFRYASPVTHKPREMGLGRAGKGAVSLEAARKESERLRAMIRDGLDPLEERRRRTAVQAGKKTLTEVAEAYIAEKEREWSASSLEAWKRFAKRDIASIACLSVDSIERDHLKQAVTPFVSRGHFDTALATQARIQTLLGYAAEHGWRPEGKATRWSKIAPQPRGEQRHHAMIPWEDAPAVVAMLRRSKTVTAPLLEFIILTAVRLSEARLATFDEIDDRAVWTIPAKRMKLKRDHAVPLSSRALEIVAELQALRPKGRYIFPSDNGSPMSKQGVWAFCCRVTEDRATVHGWRATFGTWCDDSGVDTIVSEACLAHAKGAVEKAYKRSDLLERRRLVMQQWADYLDGKAAGNVIPLRATGTDA
jgi:integrase